MGGESEDPIQRCFDASYRRLVGQLYGVCGDLSEAEDVVAEAFAKAVSRRRTFERLDNPEAWLRTVAVNVARSRHRRRVVGERLLGRTAQPDAVHQPDLSDDRMQVVAALRTLPDHQRETLALHYLADLPVAEVAATLGVPEGTVKARLSRGRTALAAALGHDGSDVLGGSHA
ncbi:SigE family RNA polymerase sigma factor [Nocardioides immobilis]|uniref:SigE family RNA polymerase sigma factor n=1 Tax=Nocardioides immobilis TaxID=2049295 RepID=A0A417Y7T7_9ACTN|nr:SigE family RNA polymerase sigma factor [Nocardioides immobilis]RHW28749.1 SigE family RNA polymerase sigma factor [Nocardioides immobilis]